jgi:hypothetical protein
MELTTYYPLVALQFNISSGSRSKDDPPRATRECSRFLIREYLRRVRSDLVLRPAFIALHGDATKLDGDSIADAFKERDPKGKGKRMKFCNPDTRGDGVGLLYDPMIVEQQLDDSAILTPSDFNSYDLTNRIKGGLFRHMESNKFIVAVSYRGPYKPSTDFKKGNIMSNVFLTFIH